MGVERRGSDQFRTPYKMVTEVISISTAYTTGGWTLQSRQLTLLERVTALQGLLDYGNQLLCRCNVPCDMETGLLTGNTFKLQAFYAQGASSLFTSGQCWVEAIDGTDMFSGWCTVLLMEGR